MSLSTLAVSAALLSLVHALPQKPDLFAIAAAPTVANGPAPMDADAGAQTATLYTSFTVASAMTAPSPAASPAVKRALPIQKRDQTFSSDVTDSADSAGFGGSSELTTLNSGVDYSMDGGSTHNFLGNVDNNGRILVSQSDYLRQNHGAGGQTSHWVGHDANNGNLINAAGSLIQLNDFGATSASTYDWSIRSMQNKGTIQWCGRGDTGGSTYQMYNDLTSTNDGLISFEQFYDNQGTAFVWRNPTLTTASSTSGQNLYNNGAFRLINVNYHNVQNVYGNGSWQIGKGGILYLEDGTGLFQNPTQGPCFPGQSICFQDGTAVLHMDTGVYSCDSTFGAQVYGYGHGNAIEFYETIRSFNYTDGVLNVQFIGGNQVRIPIGPGYDASKFATRRNPQKYNPAGYNAIFYDDAAPQQYPPAQCEITAPECSNPSGGEDPYRTPYTTNTASTTSTTVGTTTYDSSSASRTSSTSTSEVSGTSTTAAPRTTEPPTSTKTCPTTPYTPYYAVLTTGYTTDPALSATRTTTAGQACPTMPEAGTDCGFINPLDPCAPQPDGYGPVPTPDTAPAFVAFDELHASASAAPNVVPSSEGTQYTQVFQDLDGATSAQSYLGLYTLPKYDTQECAAKCDCTELCTAFNLYAERDPCLNPTNRDSTYDPGYPTVWGDYCPDPPSMTSFKCTLWGSHIDASTATKTGETREQFQIVITASNGYDKTNVTIPPSPPPTTADHPNHYPQPQNCQAKAIDAPQYWLGSKFFPGPFNPLVCAAYASKQSAVNFDAGAQQVRMYNAYYLHKGGRPHGTQCSLYNSALEALDWATYEGEKGYRCVQSWTFGL